MDFPGGLDGKESACNAWDLPLGPRLGRSPGEGNGNLLQYSCLENPHGQRRVAGCGLWGCKELDTDWATKQKQQQDAYRLTEASKGRSHALQADSLPSKPPGKSICRLRFLKLADYFSDLLLETFCIGKSWLRLGVSIFLGHIRIKRPELKNKNKKKDSQCNQPTRCLSLK